MYVSEVQHHVRSTMHLNLFRLFDWISLYEIENWKIAIIEICRSVPNQLPSGIELNKFSEPTNDFKSLMFCRTWNRAQFQMNMWTSENKDGQGCGRGHGHWLQHQHRHYSSNLHTLSCAIPFLKNSQILISMQIADTILMAYNWILNTEIAKGILCIFDKFSHILWFDIWSISSVTVVHCYALHIVCIVTLYRCWMFGICKFSNFSLECILS